MKTMVDIHADDYGYSLNTSKDIIECIQKNDLDSFSIICNTNDFESSEKLLYESIPTFKYLPCISVHLNLPEGNGVTDLIPISWAKLFLASYSFSQKEIKEKIKKEFKYQIDTVWKVVSNCIEIAKKNNIEVRQKAIRLDSHVHTHPLPIVFESLIELIEEENYEIEFIRNPKEPIKPFLKNKSLIKTYGLANMLKNRILMSYSKKIDDYCDKKKIDKMYMWGLMMSGKMDYDRVKAIYPDMLKEARDNHRNLEILFHPGIALKQEYSDEKDSNYFRDSNSHENRHIEKNTVINIKDIIE